MTTEKQKMIKVDLAEHSAYIWYSDEAVGWAINDTLCDELEQAGMLAFEAHYAACEVEGDYRGALIVIAHGVKPIDAPLIMQIVDNVLNECIGDLE